MRPRAITNNKEWSPPPPTLSKEQGRKTNNEKQRWVFNAFLLLQVRNHSHHPEFGVFGGVVVFREMGILTVFSFFSI
jgi:hypothetical protein